jgi:hypothetical protein
MGRFNPSLANRVAEKVLDLFLKLEVQGRGGSFDPAFNHLQVLRPGQTDFFRPQEEEFISGLF